MKSAEHATHGVRRINEATSYPQHATHGVRRINEATSYPQHATHGVRRPPTLS